MALFQLSVFDFPFSSVHCLPPLAGLVLFASTSCEFSCSNAMLPMLLAVLKKIAWLARYLSGHYASARGSGYG